MALYPSQQEDQKDKFHATRYSDSVNQKGYSVDENENGAQAFMAINDSVPTVDQSIV